MACREQEWHERRPCARADARREPGVGALRRACALATCLRRTRPPPLAPGPGATPSAAGGGGRHRCGWKSGARRVFLAASGAAVVLAALKAEAAPGRLSSMCCTSGVLMAATAGPPRTLPRPLLRPRPRAAACCFSHAWTSAPQCRHSSHGTALGTHG